MGGHWAPREGAASRRENHSLLRALETRECRRESSGSVPDKHSQAAPISRDPVVGWRELLGIRWARPRS